MDVLDFDSQDEDEDETRELTPDSIEFSVLGTSNASHRRHDISNPGYLMPTSRFSQDYRYQHSTLITPPQTLFAPSKFSIPQVFLHDPVPFSSASLRRHNQQQRSDDAAEDLNLSEASKERQSSTVSLISPTSSLERKMQENLEHDLSWLNRDSKSISPIQSGSNHNFEPDLEKDLEKKENIESKSKDLDLGTPLEGSFHMTELFKEGDQVLRSDEQCTILNIDYSLDPPQCTIKVNSTGDIISTELHLLQKDQSALGEVTPIPTLSDLDSSDNIFPSKILPLEPSNEPEMVLERISPIAASYPIEDDHSSEPANKTTDLPIDKFSETQEQPPEAKSISRSPSFNEEEKLDEVPTEKILEAETPIEIEKDLPQTPPVPLHNYHSSIAPQIQHSRRFTFSHLPAPEIKTDRRHTFSTSSTPPQPLHSSTLNISSQFVNKPVPHPPEPKTFPSQRFDPPTFDNTSLHKIDEIKLDQIFETEAYKETLAHTDKVLQTMEDRCKVFLLPNPSTFTPEQLHEQLTVSRYLIRKLYTERNIYLEKYTKANVGCQRFRHTVQEFERERNYLRQEIQLIKTKFLSGVDDPEKFAEIRGEIMKGLQAENEKLRHEMFSMQESFFAFRHRAECALAMLSELDAGWRSEMETVRTEYIRMQTLRDHFKTKDKEMETDLNNQNKIIQSLKEELIVAETKKEEHEAQMCKQREKFDELLSTLKATENKLESANEVITMMEKEIYDKDKEMGAVLIANSNLREELEDRLRPSNTYELPQQTRTNQEKEKNGLISTFMTQVEKMLTKVAESCPHPSTVKKVRSVLARVDRNRNLWTSNFV